MQTDLITKVYFNEHLTHSCVGMPQGLQALLSSCTRIEVSVLRAGLGKFLVTEIFFRKNIFLES